MLIEELSVVKEGTQPTKFATEYARPFSFQFVELMKRSLNEYWRNPGYNAVRCIFCTVLGLLLGSIYYQVRSIRARYCLRVANL